MEGVPTEQAEGVPRLMHRGLGTGALGVHPHGSAVLGGPRPHSDLDLLVALRRHTRARRRAALVRGCRAPGPARRGGRAGVAVTGRFPAPGVPSAAIPTATRSRKVRSLVSTHERTGDPPRRTRVPTETPTRGRKATRSPPSC